MLTFHNDPAIKEKYLARLRAHAAADKIVKGKYWENGKGCAVGCTIEGDDHKRYETELGIPESIAWLEDRIFEGLPNDLAMTFPLRFLEAIPVGADLSDVVPSMMIYVLTDCRIHADRAGQDAIDTVIALYRRRLTGAEPTEEEWAAAAGYAGDAARAAWAAAAGYAGDAARAAWAAAGNAARAAWAAAAGYAGDAGDDAAWAAARAAWAAGDAAWAAAGDAAYIRYSEELIRLISQ